MIRAGNNKNGNLRYKDFDIILGVDIMQIISGYFISRQQALEAAEYLRQKGFKDEISVIGRNNEEEDIEKTETLINTDDISYNGAGLGFDGLPMGLASFMIQGGGQLFTGVAIPGVIGTFSGEVNRMLSQWGVPKNEGEEIKRVVDSGNSVVLIKCEDNERQFVSNALQYKGAQNIHS